jgi:hypothetical protein
MQNLVVACVDTAEREKRKQKKYGISSNAKLRENTIIRPVTPASMSCKSKNAFVSLRVKMYGGMNDDRRGLLVWWKLVTIFFVLPRIVVVCYSAESHSSDDIILGSRLRPSFLHP